MPCFLVRHLIKDLGGGGIVLAQSLCKAAVDAAVLFLIGDSECEDLLLTELGEGLHVGLEVHGRAHNTSRSPRLQRGDAPVSRLCEKNETGL
jgi:hypothetical protein